MTLVNGHIARSLKEPGASSSRDGAGNEPPPRPAESSVSADQPPRKQSDDADMSDLERQEVSERTER